MPIEVPAPDKNELLSVTSAGSPVKSRITSLAAAIHLFTQELAEHKTDAVRRARIAGMINGNPPYDQQQLDELGLGYMINVNFQEMKAMLDAKAAANYELFFEVPTLIEARQVSMVDPQQPAADYGAVVAEEFTKLCFDWSGFLPFMDKVRRESDAYGLGVGGFRDGWDWRPRAFNCGSFMTTKRAEMDIEKLPYAFLRDPFQIGDLFELALTDPEAATKEGWNLGQVRRLMKKVFIKEGPSGVESGGYQTSMWEAAEQRIRNGEFVDYEKKQFEFLPLVHLLVRELDDGMVSHYIFDEGATEMDGFLFKKSRKYTSMGQALWWLPYNNGDGFLHSIRGLASMLEHHCDLSNRYLGRVFDAGFTQASLLLQPNSAGDLSQLQLIRMGMVTVIPHNVKAIQSSFQPNVMQLVQLRDLSSSIMRNNTGVFRQHSELAAEQQTERTAYEVSQQVAREARSEKSNIAFDYEQVQKLYREMFRRVTDGSYIESSVDRPGLKDARRFVVRCLARGVPYELLTTPKAFDVYATRAIGMGSWGVKLDLSNQLLSTGSTFMDEQGRRNAQRDWVAVRVGYHNVDKYVPLVNRDTIPSNEKSIATLENNDMMEGSASVVGSDQFHTIHVTTHAELAMGIMTMYQKTQGQGMKVADTLAYLGQAIPHIEQHLQYLSVDPTRADFVKSGVEMLKMLTSFADVLTKHQEQMQAVQEKQNQKNQQVLGEAQQVLQDREMQVELAKVEKDFQIELRKQDSLNAARATKTAEQLRIRSEQSQANQQLQQQKLDAEVALQNRKLDAEIELKKREQQSKPRSQ